MIRFRAALYPLIAGAALAAGGCTVTQPRTPSEALAAIGREYWNFQMQQSPTWATRLGDHRFDDRLGATGPDARAERLAAYTGFLEQVRSVDTASLPAAERITAEVLEVQLELAVAAQSTHEWEWDVDQIFGPQVWFFQLLNYHPVRSVRDVEAFASRLEAFGPYIDAHIADLRGGLESGRLPFRGAVERVIAQARAHVAKGAEGAPLWGIFEKLPGGVDESLRKRLASGIEDGVIGAMQRYAGFLEQELLPQARGPESPGIAGLPGAAEHYAHAIRKHARGGLTPEAIHQTGLAEVKRIRAAMEAIAAKRGFAGDFAGFLESLEQDPANFYDSREAIEEHARTLLAEASAKLPELFGVLPQTRCEVKAIEVHRERDSVAAFYNGPPADGSRPGIYYINTYKPESRPRYNMAALTIHEAVPGHHLQIALAVENDGLPQFRRHSHFTAYIEGWALYSERLGQEIGLYDTDLELLGMYTYEAWRACRLVVDTGLHHYGWSRAQAIQYMQDNLALSDTEIINEVDRYIIWPGQALAYKTGQLEILRLRDEAQAALGDAFVLSDFHDLILGIGAVPLDVLGRVVGRWVEAGGGPPQ
jgi:uncharacterized protein (DUF885 family)